MKNLQFAIRRLIRKIQTLPIIVRNMIPPVPLPIGGVWLFGVPLKRRNKPYESELTTFIRNTIKPGMTFVDIGANIGYYTVIAAKLGANIIAFEPDPTAFRRLTQNIALHRLKTVTARSCAVSNKIGHASFHIQKPRSPVNSLFVQFPNQQKITVETTTCTESFDLCKIDVEGAELLVLDGLMHRGATIIEISLGVLASIKKEPKEYLQNIRERGYEILSLQKRPMSDNEIIRQASEKSHVELLLIPIV